MLSAIIFAIDFAAAFDYFHFRHFFDITLSADYAAAISPMIRHYAAFISIIFATLRFHCRFHYFIDIIFGFSFSYFRHPLLCHAAVIDLLPFFFMPYAVFSD